MPATPRSFRADDEAIPPTPKAKAKAKAKAKGKAKAKATPEDRVIKLRHQISKEIDNVKGILDDVPDEPQTEAIKKAMQSTLQTLDAKSIDTVNDEAGRPHLQRFASAVLPFAYLLAWLLLWSHGRRS